MEIVLTRVSKAIISAKTRGYSSFPPSLAISEKDRKSIYLQYRENCNKRIEMTEELFRDFVKSEISDMPEYLIHREEIAPSSKTIDVQGEFWRD